MRFFTPASILFEYAKTYVNVITASAADSMTKPVLIKRQAYSNKIEAGVKNLTSFSSKTTFEDR